MIPRTLDSITKADIDALVAHAVSEGRTIEYKEHLPGGSDDEKREFLADASSFANAAGGDLIYGIREKRDANGKATGIPEAAEGLAGANADSEIRRLEEIVRSGIDPRIPGLRLKRVDGFSSGPVILLRIQKSWVSPHMVTFKNQSRFFTRTSAGKHQLDVGEIRVAFEIASTLKTSVESFRIDRLAKIEALETPIPMNMGPKCVLHLYPFSSADHTSGRDITLRANELPNIQPFYNLATPRKLNFDGLVSFYPPHDGTTHAYVQVFRNAVIEGVFNCAFIDLSKQSLSEQERQNKQDKVLSASHVEGYARRGVSEFLKVLRELEIEMPVVLMMSLVGVSGMELGIDSPWRAFQESAPFDRSVLALPEAIIDSFDRPVDELLRPMFDVAWQASGVARSRNYNPQGRWDGGLSVMQGNV